MNKKKELISTNALVETLLKQESVCRNSDNFLYYRVISEIAKRKSIDLNNVSILSFLLSMSGDEFPAFETVRRTRQKVQERYPELQSIKRIKEKRKANEEIFREFARGEL